MRLFFYIRIFVFFCPLVIFAQFREKVAWESLNWRVIHSTHFDIHYPQGYDFLGEKSVEIAEQANILIGEKLEHNISEVIPVYIYPSHNHFQMTHVIPDFIDEGIGGLTESGKKRILIPYSGSYDELRHTLSHEIVHAFQYDLLLYSGVGEYIGVQSQPTTPLWFIEGMAEYYSIGWDSRTDMILRDAVLSDTMPSLQDMNDYRVVNPIIFYKAGQSVFQYIALTYGEKKIPELFRDTRDQRNIENAFKTNFGVSFEDFNRDWLLWLKRTYYKDVDKNSGSESGRFGTSHLKDKSIINLYPTISPDGKKIAWLTVRNYNPVIVMLDTDDIAPVKNYDIREEKKPGENIVVRAGDSEEFYQLHLIDNNISFTSDSKYIFFSARSYGKDVLYLFDYQRKKVVKSWQPGFDMIQHPSLSFDNNLAVFAGSRNGKTDLYLLDLKTDKLDQLTNDYFSEKDPVFSRDDKMIYYSSNVSSNSAKKDNIENTDYDIFVLERSSKKSRRLFSLEGVQEKPQILPGNQNPSIMFISDHEGAINAYTYTPTLKGVKGDAKGEIKRVTNSFEGILSIKPDEKANKFIMAVYREQGYDIALYNNSDRDVDDDRQKPEKLNDTFKKNYFLPFFPRDIPFLTGLIPEPYKPRFTLDAIYFGLAWSNYGGFGGFAIFSVSEYMGIHRFQGLVDFLTDSGSSNYYLDYTFLKYRLIWQAGLFRSSSYFSILNLMDLTTLNNLIYDPNQFTQSLYRFGGYAKAVYPWTNFLKNDLGIEIFRYEEIFRTLNNLERPNISTNVFAVSTSLVFNNALYSYYGPLKGTYLGISDRQTLNLTGGDYVYNSVTLDVRQYLNFFERYVLAMRFMGGAVSGPQKDFFPWRIGGPFTMRGYDFLTIQGIYTFLVNLELRFPLIDYIIMGFPVPWALRGFTAVAFIDTGGAFNDFNTFKWYDDQNNTLKDLKLSYGIGLRVLLVPGILLRFDWATPWDFKNTLSTRFNFSLGYEY